MASRYVISDIHGCNKTFRKLIVEKLQLSKDDELYLLGDFVDRGPDTKGVLDYILELQENFQLHLIRGNHEQIMLDARSDLELSDQWKDNHGGDQTLKSFGVKDIKDIPEVYFQLIDSMGYYIELPDTFLVHAGFNFKDSDPFEDYNSMLYIRDFPIDNELVRYKKIIHGHTPVPLSTIDRAVESGFQEINIDNGCVFGDASEYGNLVALELNSMKLIVQPNVE